MKTKRRFLWIGCVLVCLAISMGALFKKPEEPPAPRARFLGFTYASNSWPMARFSVTNDATTPQLAMLVAKWDDHGIVRPAMKGRESIGARFIRAPLPGRYWTNVSLPVPSTNVGWFVEVASAPEHSAIEGALGRLSSLMRAVGIEVHWGLKPMRLSGEKVVVPKYEEGRSN